jgi:hypothetical protein
MSDVSGSCLCGAVSYEIRPPYVFFQYCHCSRCRKFTGAAHAANIFVSAEQFRWTAGEDKVRQHVVPDAKYYCSAFCTVCGSSMPWKSRNDKFYLVPAGTLDDEPGAEVQRNIYWGSRAPWYKAVADLPTHDELPEVDGRKK